MSDVVVDVKALFMKDVEYVLGHGIIVTYQDGYLRDRNGNRISTDDYPVLPMINYHPQVKAGEYTSTLPSPEDQYENVVGRAIESEEVIDKLKFLRKDDEEKIKALMVENMNLSVENAKLKEDLESRPKVVETENFKRVGEWLVGFNPKGGVNQVISLEEVSEFKQSSCNVVFNNCGEWILEGTVEELLQVLQ